MNPSILVKYPTRSRPALFFATLNRYLADLSVRVLVSLDADDPTMTDPAVLERLARIPRVKVRMGDSRGKVEAINDGVADEPWGVLILGSDDMIPQRPDYAQHLAGLLLARFTDGDGVLHTNDGRVGEKLNTQVVCGRKWFDRFGYLYHSDYVSVFCDDELTAVSRGLGRSHWVDEVVLKHEWVDATGHDQLHVRNESFYSRDAETFEARRACGFPI